jgi:hypothetical protein
METSDFDLEIAINEIEASGLSDPGNYDEKAEAARRSDAMFIGYYAENGPTFDPDGEYLCKTCKFRLEGNEANCVPVEGPIDLNTGSCMVYMIGPASDKSEELKKKLTQIQSQYTERPNKKAYGCTRCEYGAKAKSEDSAGRSLWCSFWGMHVMKPSCCMMNEGDDDILAPASNLDAAIDELLEESERIKRNEIVPHGITQST